MAANIAAAVAVIREHVSGVQAPDDASTNLVDDWKLLPELPTSGELLSHASSDDLPWARVTQSWESKEKYLEAQYKILRFEGVEGLRYSAKSLRARPALTDDDNTCIYTKVRIKGYLFTTLGPIAQISFSTQRAGVKINWKQSKRLQPGKIIALSSDFFKTDCRVAVIAQPVLESDPTISPRAAPTLDITWAKSSDALVNPDQDLVMVESRNGYFEAVRHALKGLQHAAREVSPLDKYVFRLDKNELNTPTTLKTIDYSSLVDHLTPDQLRPGNKKAEQQAFRDTEDRFKKMSRKAKHNLDAVQPYTSLDESQLHAFQRIITKELAIVQGPPGTGKTFTSVRSITAILKNRQPGDPPIIVSAQTNHALDQLLIYCKSAGASIMRVGGRTENDEIAQRTMYELRRAARLGGVGLAIDAQRSKIVARFEGLVKGVFGGDGLLDPQTLLDAGIINEAQLASFVDDQFETNEDLPAMEAWLGVNKIPREYEQMEDPEFNEFEAADEMELDPNFNDDPVEVEEDRLRGRFVPMSSKYTGRKPYVAMWEMRCKQLLKAHDDLYDIPTAYRGGVYQAMERMLREVTAPKFCGLLAEATKQAQDHKVAAWTRDLALIDRVPVDIVGCTTTGLTKYRGFLAAIKARVLLIEEAAETREANIASALYPSINQLILVGDHQQLPPSCDIARLASDPYNLNVSLFERLIANNLPYTMLNCQRRMAPELRYIVQKFYPTLKDHPLVKDVAQRPLVPGMGDRRSWFFTHQWPEDIDADNSKFNQAEVEMIVSFILYLLHNHVKPPEITILTYYRGQKRKLIQRLRGHKGIPAGTFFNVATVDSYQGEENEIVILSLVRSPAVGRDPQVGFLDSRNRATVAISRARRGFFMFGNKENLMRASNESFQTWAPIWNGFAEQKRVAMGKGLPLICQNHGSETWMKDSDDFVGNAGGCRQECGGKLPCGHGCPLACHNVSHDVINCMEPCTARLECGHKCSGFCTDPCECAINCPAYVQVRDRIREEKQIAAAQAQIAARFRETDARVSNPDRLALLLQTRTPSPNDWQDMAKNPKAHDAALRAEHLRVIDDELRAMGDVRDVDAILKAAFENIQETFIPVTEKDGRRVLGAGKITNIREENRRREQEAATARLDGACSVASVDAHKLPACPTNITLRVQGSSGSTPNRGGISRTGPNGGAFPNGGGFPNGGSFGNGIIGRPRQPEDVLVQGKQRIIGQTAISRGGYQNGRGGNRGANRGANRGGYRGNPKTESAMRPAPINSHVANAHGMTVRAPADVHVSVPANGRLFSADRALREVTKDDASLSPKSQRDVRPEGASVIDDTGFEYELDQATQRQRGLTTHNTKAQTRSQPRVEQRSQPRTQPPVQPRVQPVQKPESLINFGDDSISVLGSQDSTKGSSNSAAKGSSLHLLLDL